MTWKVPLFRIFYDSDDLSLMQETISSGMNWAVGTNVTQFEEKIAEYNGLPYCVTFNSGTSALHAVLLAGGIGRGDEVIVPSFTFIATANAPKFVQAIPIFADIEENFFGLDPESVMERITPRTKAIMPVHYGGCPCRIKELREIANDHNLLLIEDAAEAFGAKLGDQNVGSFGHATMFSFCQNKIIPTGEGGAIVTRSRDLYEKMKLIRSHGRPDTCDYFSTTDTLDYISLGYNFRMSNITASLGLSQMKKIDFLIGERQRIARYYTDGIEKCPVLNRYVKVQPVPQDIRHVYQLFSVRAQNRDLLIKHLATLGIMTKVYFSPIHKTHFYTNNGKDIPDLPVTESVASDIISLPIYPGMPIVEMDAVISGMTSYYEGI